MATDEQRHLVAFEVARLVLARVSVDEDWVERAAQTPTEADREALLTLSEDYACASLAAHDDQARAVGALAWTLTPDGKEAARYAIYEAGYAIHDDEAIVSLILGLLPADAPSPAFRSEPTKMRPQWPDPGGSVRSV